MSFDTFATNYDTVSVFFPGLTTVERQARMVIENTKFKTSFSTLKSGVHAYVLSPTLKNEAKAWGAIETFHHFLVRNMLSTHVGFVTPFVRDPETLSEVTNIIEEVLPSLFAPDMNGMYQMSLIVNSVRVLLKSPAYSTFAGN